MIDELLFQRGHIMVRIGDEIEDYDWLIPEHYFKNILGLEGEGIDSNGSEYKVISHTNDKVIIQFTVYENEFEFENKVAKFDELHVQCECTLVEEDGMDILDIDEYNVLSVTGEQVC